MEIMCCEVPWINKVKVRPRLDIKGEALGMGPFVNKGPYKGGRPTVGIFCKFYYYIQEAMDGFDGVAHEALTSSLAGM